MRITGGIARGTLLKTVDEPILRPATDYLRQAIFSSLGDVVQGATFLDIFAGVGSYGLEAWSRGASDGLFIENNAHISSILTRNHATVKKSIGAGNNCKIWHCDALKTEIYEQFDLIFIDPPYALARSSGAEILAKAKNWLRDTEHARIIFEMPVDLQLPAPEPLTILRRIEKKGKNSPAAVIYGRA